MPLPSQVHIDTYLSGLLLGTKQDNYIADKVMPPIFTNKLTGKIAKLDREHYRIDFMNRAPGTAGHAVEFTASSTSYSIDEFRLEFAVDDAVKDLYDEPYDAYRDGTFTLQEKLLLKKEQLVASFMTTTGNYLTTSSSDLDWHSAGNPIADIQAGINVVVARRGVSPNNFYGFCSWGVYQVLRANTIIKGLYTSTAPAAYNMTNVDPSALARILGLKDLFVGSTIQNTAAKGATESFSYLWGTQTFGIAYIPERTGIMAPAFAYQVFPNIPVLPGGQVAIDRYRNEAITSDVIRARMLMDQISGDTGLGYFWQNVGVS